MTVPILEAEQLLKQYATVCAVSQVSFAIRPGEIFALLGPNGAGKTSTVRMLIGLTRPDSGRVLYRGAEREANHVLPRELGYLPEERGLYAEQPVLTGLLYLARLRGMTKADAKREALCWLERLGLADRAREKVSALSKGNQQKVQLIAAVIHRPRFAILDEPFSGFDPINQELAVELIRELRAAGMTVLLSAHQMTLVERLADRLLLLNHGAPVLTGTLAELRAASGLAQKLTLGFDRAYDEARLFALPGVAALERLSPTHVALLLREGTDLNGLLTALGAGARLVQVQSDPVGLHEIYLRAVGAPLVPETAPATTGVVATEVAA